MRRAGALAASLGLLAAGPASAAEAPCRPTPVGDACAFGALGAQWLPWVGDEADIVRGDPVATATVRIIPAALGLHLDAPGGVYVHLRAEEGQAHEGGLESSEAQIGWRHGPLEVELGRQDLAFTRSRSLEAEDRVMTLPLLEGGRRLPSHVNGVAVAATAPRIGSLRLGVAYPPGSGGQPMAWGRAELTPLGPLPQRVEGDPGRLRVMAGAGGYVQRSLTTGLSYGLTLDGALSHPRGYLEAAWAALVQLSPSLHIDESLSVSLGGRAVRTAGGDVLIGLRGERQVGIAGEELRWLGSARLARQWRAPDASVYLEGLKMRELGSGVGSTEDVVDLGLGVERANDALTLGMMLRL